MYINKVITVVGRIRACVVVLLTADIPPSENGKTFDHKPRYYVVIIIYENFKTF